MSQDVLSEPRRILLEKRQAIARAFLGSGRATSGQFAPITPRQDSSSAPLSFSQERLWLVDRWNPGSAVYNVPILYRLRGELNVAALQQSLEAIVERHETLRSSFPVVDGQAVQVIRQAAGIALPVLSLAAVSENEREQEIHRRIQDQMRVPFDLEQGDLIRATLLRMGAEEHILVLILHHIVTDAWSKGILASELAALYKAFSAQQPNPLLPLPIQYADYAQWQRDWLKGAVLERQLSYWRTRLAGAPTLLEWPMDRPRPAIPSYRGARVFSTLPLELSHRMAALSRECNTTPFMTLLAAFQVLLHRYSGQEEVVVGTLIANRTRPEVEGLIGFFTNTLALRANLAGDPTFRELLGQVRETALQAYAHQDLPFEKIIEALQPERSLSYSPIFQAIFMLQTWDGRLPELPGLNLEMMEAEQTTAKFDLVFSLIQTPNGLEACVEYNTDLFDKERMQRLLGHYETLLEGIASDPHQRLSRLPLLTQAERHQLLVAYNDTAGEVPAELCLHHLVEEQAAKTPEAVAVEYQGSRLTYAQLNARANRLAHHLRAQGIGAESRVGLCAERSFELVIGLLGILKAGAAYLPIDVSHPSHRVGLMCRDAEVAIILTHGNVGDALAEVEAPCVRIEDKDERLPAVNLSVGDPLHPAYVMYTSGSTGLPKGMVMPHKALVNLVCWHRRVLPGRTRTLQFTSIGFDVSVQEIFVTWCNGGTVVLISEEARRDTSTLLQILDMEAVERLFVPFAVLQHLGFALTQGAAVPRALREVITAGEPLQMTSEVLALLEHLPGATLHNHYGPSETHAATSFTLREDALSAPFLPPIGKPILNAWIYLLDSRMQLVPQGVPGEVYVGGAGLARGYLMRSDLTAERFVPDPFHTEPGARMYRAGDLARYLPDGNLEYLGRMDHQVKIRGFRVELGEIESVLLKDPRVREAVVIAREDAPGDRRLVAYVVGADRELGAGELRKSLRDLLPGYMVPSAFVLMEALPLNANRKVDRKALPVPCEAAGEQEEGYTSPRNEVEAILAEIWSQALRVQQVGITDNFFELGGHSLLATQVMARIREVFRVEMPLRDLFERPTIALLGQKLLSGIPGGEQGEEAAIRRADRSRPQPLSFAQERLWFMDQLQSGNSLFNLPMALHLSGRLDVEALRRSLAALQQRHDVLRTVFALEKGQVVQIIREEAGIPLSVSDSGLVPEDRRAEIVEGFLREEARRPFDLAHGPVYRCSLLRLAPEEHVMALTLHHIAADDTTTAVFMNELSALYRAEITGRPAELPELPVQYADYAAWQRERFEQGRFENQVDYWRRQLQDAPPILGIPADYPRPRTPAFSRQSHRFLISAETLQQVTRLCHQEAITPFMFFMAAFQLLLCRNTDRKDILVGTDVLNRDRPETQNLIGFFINQLVLRTDLSACADFRQLLRCVRSVALDGYANQELPFNKLVELLRPERDPERPPYYQVKLAYTKGEASSVEFEGLAADWMPVDKGTAQLDLTLFLRERPEGVYGRMEYRDEIYRPATITRLVKEYEKIVQAYAQDPGLPLEEPETVAPVPSKPDARERMLANRAKLLGRAGAKGA